MKQQRDIKTTGRFSIYLVAAIVASAGSLNAQAPQPSVGSLTPSQMPAGAPSFTMLVSGAGFSPNTVVWWWDGFRSTQLTVTSRVSTIEIRVTVPESLLLLPRMAEVRVSEGLNGPQSRPRTFIISTAPLIRRLEPHGAAAGGPGFTLRIIGDRFNCSAGAAASKFVAKTASPPIYQEVRWNGNPLPAVCGSPIELQAAVPAALIATVGVAAINVVDFSTNSQSNTVEFAIVSPGLVVPVITSLNPSFGIVGSGAVNLVIGGSGFAPGAVVRWNSTALTPTFVTPTQIQVLIPAYLLATRTTAYITVENGVDIVSNSFSFVVNPEPLRLSPEALPDGNVGTPYSQQFAASGGDGRYFFALRQGVLPEGLQFDAATATIRGTPAREGRFSFSISVSDSSGSILGRAYTLVIAPSTLTITTASAAQGQAGVPYEQQFQASGGTGPYRWSFADSGTPPPGLELSVTGFLSGIPSRAGTYVFGLRVTDSTGRSVSREYTIFVGPGITISPLPPGEVGRDYSATLTATGGEPPYSWSLVGGLLPSGLNLSPGGAVTGVPTRQGVFAFTIQVSDVNNRQASRDFTVDVSLPLGIGTEGSFTGRIGTAFSQTITAAGGSTPYTWSLASSGFPGLSIDPATGTLAASPSLPGTYSFIVEVRDASGRVVTKTFTARIDSDITIGPGTLPAGTAGSAYSTTLSASGGIAPYTWSVSGLPSGLNADPASGVVSGTPSVIGSFPLTVTAQDARGIQGIRELILSVGLPRLSGLNITIPQTVAPDTQPPLGLEIGQPFPVDLDGEMTLTFAPQAVTSSPGLEDDPAIQFSTGGRTLTFRIPAGSSMASFGSGQPALQVGTVAGVITLTVRLRAGTTDVTAPPLPTRTIRIEAAPPVIRSVRVVRTATGYEVLVNGYSTSREVLRARFRFSPAAGANLRTQEATVDVASFFQTWYASSSSSSFGSQFTFTMPFTVQGDLGAVTSVSVMLTNSAGNSQDVSGSL
ncbi:MAG: putative Ig domain-containing protein [Bryobacteraceae bacterium]|nr:putative Ig domain-containing protein [Bryobacterales bacterium]NUM99469.1 putative Ig domain-containing protein [Bryobacteraceae bacterium]